MERVAPHYKYIIAKSLLGIGGMDFHLSTWRYHKQQSSFTLLALVPFTSKCITTKVFSKYKAPNASQTSKKTTPIPRTILSYHWDTHPPTKRELHKAAHFFDKHPPTLLFSHSRFFRLPLTEIPEVAFLGLSNVGKSSLLNAILGGRICHVSANPGMTRTMNFFAVGGENENGNKGKITVLDMPGYGKGSGEEWRREVEKYLTGRREYDLNSFTKT